MAGAPLGNENAKKWTDEEIDKIAKKIEEYSDDAYSIVGIIAKLNITQDVYYDLVERYPIVSQVNDLAKNKISEKAWKHGFMQKGFPNILQLAIRNHDKGNKKIDAKEHTKRLEREVAAKLSLAVQLAKEGVQSEGMTPQQALLIDSIVEERVKEALKAQKKKAPKKKKKS